MSAERDRGRLLALLCDRALGERLGEDEEIELELLLERNPDVDPESFERAASAIHMALIRPVLGLLPTRLRALLLSRSTLQLGQPPSKVGLHQRPWLGWVVAAAALLMMFVRTVADRPAELPSWQAVVDAQDSIRGPWTATGDAAAAGITGEVVWSDSLQAGFMVFRGLSANEPAMEQYQLWIFDPARPEEYPVDGGVFDASELELTVPVDAKLPVTDPTLFAITLEPSGGVVVSSRERLLLTASPQG